MTDPQRIRRRVDDEAPAEDPRRRGCLLVGALLGVAAGVLIALFVVPPLFDRYFGTADIALGKRHTDAGRSITVTGYREESPAGATVPVVVTARLAARDGWELDLSTVTLEFDGDIIVGGATARPGDVRTVRIAAGAEEAVELVFQRPAGLTAKPHLVHFRDPKARFYLQPGEPE